MRTSIIAQEPSSRPCQVTPISSDKIIVIMNDVSKHTVLREDVRLDMSKEPSTGEERRRKTRRTADKILVQTTAILQILERISRGEDGDHTEYYADLAALIDRAGRRQEDRKLAKLLFASLEGIANNINKLLEKDKALRKVRITKMRGKKVSQVDVNDSLEGWEAERPRVGEIYRVYKDDGGMFSSSVVLDLRPGYIQTQNSEYRIETVLN